MKDLKHMICFEHLLEDAHNDLVRKAKDDGRLAFGYTCYHVPEVLMNLDGCFFGQAQGTKQRKRRYCYILYGKQCL